MKLDPKSEEFLATQLDELRRAIETYGGTFDRTWALSSRLSQILAAQAFASIAVKLGFEVAENHDTIIEVHVDGTSFARYETAFLRTEIAMALKESVQSVIDTPQVRAHVMALDKIGDDAIPGPRYPEEDEEQAEEP